MSELKFSLEHLGLPAQQPAALKDWYVNVLGGTVVFENPPAYFVALPGGVMLEIYAATAQRPETANNGLAGFRHLALRVESIATVRAELEQRGVKFTEPVKPAGDSVFNAKAQRREDARD
jgi:catechol 2,3-dioxygenase-like lactoylglutathione lyase family enzyme